MNGLRQYVETPMQTPSADRVVVVLDVRAYRQTQSAGRIFMVLDASCIVD
jgi:hypothetical protein